MVETTWSWHLMIWLMALVVLPLDAARILAVFPATSRSHVISFSSLTKELALRGHHVTVVTSYPQQQPVENYTDIVIPLNTFGIERRMNMNQMTKLDIIDNLSIILELGMKTCEHYLNHPSMKRLISSPNEHFDLLIVEVFLNECFLGFAHRFKVPIVGVSVFDAQHWSLSLVGNPSPYSFTPNIFLGYSDHMNFVERLVNTIGTLSIQIFRDYFQLPQQDIIMRRYFNDSTMPHVRELERTTSLLLLNNHVSLSYPRPYLPNVIEVGGMHITPETRLPQDLKKYMDHASNGVIIFSMGTNLKSFQMPPAMLKAFVSAFSQLDQKVLWSWDLDHIPGLSGNVKLAKWLPQSSLLAHPNTKLLLTHGGLLSMQEAIYYGKPMVGIPIFADQEQNMFRAEKYGFGIRLKVQNLTCESLLWAIRTVLNQTSYHENAMIISQRFHDKPMTPIETAVFWTEYILRHKGAKHLHSASLDLPWYQYFLLDVIVVLALSALMALFVVYNATRAGLITLRFAVVRTVMALDNLFTTHAKKCN